MPRRSKGSSTPSSSSSSSQKTVLVKYDETFSTWYGYGKDLPGRDESLISSSSSTTTSSGNNNRRSVPTKKNHPDTIRKIRSMADDVYQTELRLFSQATRNKEDSSSSSAADDRWMENAMKKGTLKDRIAAMSVTVASNPVHKLYALDGLLGMVGCSINGGGGGDRRPNSRVAQLAAEALEDLFLNTLLPSDRKLISMAQRPLHLHGAENGKRTLSPRILLLWRYEELIKDKYDQFIRQYIARTLEDGTEMQKIATLQTAATLLSSVPEGEGTLLTLMVNKLGDPERKVASAAGHRLRVVLQRHSSMQTVIAREVQQLAHRPHLSPKALYNCITFLNQLQLRRSTVEEQAVAASLVKTYFRLFEVAVEKQQQTKNGNKKSKAAAGGGGGGQDQSGSMKGRLLSALLMGVNRAHPYLPEKDQDMKDHVDALYRIVHTAPPSAATQALLLLFHLAVGSTLEEDGGKDIPDNEQQQQQSLSKEQQDQTRDRYYRALYATMAKTNIVSTGKHLTMYFNVLYKAMKYDSNKNRVHAFAKRLLAGVMHGPSPSIAAALYLLQEISKTHPTLQHAWNDIPMPESNAWVALDDSKREPKAGLVNKRNQQEKEGQDGSEEEESHNLIPPMWEVSALGLHFHPSVAKFANDLGDIEFNGDPLQDFGLSQFLDKFAYRNPKSREKLLKQQPNAAGAMHSRQMNKLQSRLSVPLNDRSFLEQTDVNEQDEFFHRFFVEQARRDEIKGITRHSTPKDDGDDEDDDGWRNAAQEEDAFNAAEEAEDVDTSHVKSFEEYEAEWETDEEEERFVDTLAMQLLESEAGGPADIDDDPEGMDDWGDLDDGEDDDAAGPEAEDAESSGDNMDDAEDDGNDSDDSDSSDEEPDIDEKEIIGGIGVDSDSDNSSGSNEDDDSDDSDNLGMALVDDSEDSGSEESEDDVDDQTDRHDEGPTEFASAEDYEARIAKSFAELKRQTPSFNDTDNSQSDNHKKTKSRKKSRHR